jgi:hypothetical protein
MNFLAALYSLLKALPALIKFVEELSGWMHKQFGDDPAKFLMDSAEVFERAKNAKTPQDKQTAAGDIARLIRRL